MKKTNGMMMMIMMVVVVGQWIASYS